MSAFTQSARSTPAKIARFIRKHIYTSLFVALMWITYFTARFCVAMVLSDIPLIEYLAKTTLHQPVRIEKAEIRWHGIKPEVILANVNVLDDNERIVLMHAQEIHVGLRVFSSLFHQRLMESFIDLSDTALSIKERPDHHYEVVGFELGSSTIESGVSLDALIKFVSANKHINLNNVRVDLYSVNNDHIAFILKSLHLTNQDNHHTIKTRVDLPFANAHATFIGHFIGDSPTAQDWKGQYEFKTDNIHITDWFEQFVLHDLNIRDGDLDIQIKGIVRAGHTVTASARVDFENIKVQAFSGNKIYAIQQIAGNVIWRVRPTGWKVQANNLHMRFEDKDYQFKQVSNTVAYENNNTRKDILEMDSLNVSGLLQLARENNLVSKGTLDLIQKIQFDGNISDVSLTFIDQNFHLMDWNIEGSISHANIVDVPHVPTIQNLSGRFGLSRDKKSLVLNSQDIRVIYPDTKHSELFDNVTGKFDFNQYENGWQIEFEQFAIQDKNQTITLNGVHQHYTTGDTDNDIRVQAVGTDIRQLYQRVGSYIKNRGLRSWLQKALLGTSTYELDMHYQGKGNDFPYGISASSQLHLAVKDLDLHYDDNFPDATQVQGTLDILNRTLSGVFTQGKIGHLNLKNIRVGIDNLSQRNKILSLAGNMDVELPTDWQFLYDSHIGKHFDLLKNFNLVGKVNSTLQLAIPLYSGSQVSAKGDIDLGLNALTLQNLNLTLQNIVGKIHFENNHVVAQNLQAQFNDFPVVASIDSVGKGNQKPMTRLKIEGDIDKNGISQWVNFSGLNALSGTTHYRADLLLSQNNSDRQQVDIQSNLVGMNVNLPGQFGKTKAQSAPLAVHLDLDGENGTDVNIDYRNMLHADLVLKKSGDTQQLYGGTLMFGKGESAHLPKRPGLNILGEVDEFELMKLSDYLGYTKSMMVNVSQQEAPALSLNTVDVSVKRFYLSSLLLNDVHLVHDHKMGSQVWGLSGQDVMGSIRFPTDSGEQWMIDLQRANFHSNARHNIRTSELPSASQLDLRNFPAVGITIEKLLLNDKSLGRLEMNLQADGDSVSMQMFSLSNNWMNVMASGRLSEQHHLQLQGDAEFSAIQHLFDYADLAPLFTADRATARFNVFWDVRPQNIGLRNMNGTVTFEANDGELSQISSDAHDNINYVLLVNALSIEPISEGRFLAFSDLDRMALSYKTIQTHAEFSNGVAHVDPFTLESSYMDLALQGDLNFAQQTYDLQMKVNPYIFGSLPAVALVAGGPAAGGVALAANALMHKTLMNVVSYYFNITGPWSSPKVVPRQ